MSYHDQLEMVLFLIFWFAWCWIASPCKKQTEAVTETAEVVVHSILEEAESIINESCDWDELPPECEEDFGTVIVDTDFYLGMTIRELKSLAKLRTGTDRAIKGYSRLSKVALAKALAT